MGLDNGFELRERGNPSLNIEVAYFRKYYELDDWVRRNARRLDGDGEYFEITKSDLNKLLEEISPIVEIIGRYTYEKIAYFDDTGYPQCLVEKFYTKDFDPTSSQSAFAGNKLMRLYRSVLCMLEILDINPGNDYYYRFYSSY